MNKHIIFLYFFLSPIIFIGQNDLPEEISIKDMYHSPWIGHFEYQYKLQRKGNQYYVFQIVKIESDFKKNKETKSVKKIGAINCSLIEELIYYIDTVPLYQIRFESFADVFTEENIYERINKQTSYAVERTSQKEFLFNKLKDWTYIESLLKSYFADYDFSMAIDGATSEIRVLFSYKSKEYCLLSKSSISYALPININGRDSYSRQIVSILGEIIPKSKTKRQEQLIGGNDLLQRIIVMAIDRDYKQLNAIGVWDYFGNFIDELQHYFVISYPRITRQFSLNWNGEKRINIQLQKVDNPYPIFVDYSIQVKDDSLLYPSFEIVEKYQEMEEKLLAVDYFVQLLESNQDAEISIIYDNNSCFTDKTIENLNRNYKSSINKEDLLNALFLKTETNNKIQYWILMDDNELIPYRK